MNLLALQEFGESSALPSCSYLQAGQLYTGKQKVSKEEGREDWAVSVKLQVQLPIITIYNGSVETSKTNVIPALLWTLLLDWQMGEDSGPQRWLVCRFLIQPSQAASVAVAEDLAFWVFSPPNELFHQKSKNVLNLLNLWQ